MRFIETPAFTARVRRLLSDDSYRELQFALLLRPGQGALIPGTRGLRKMRWASGRRGKRGGIRAIYYWAPHDEAFYMLFVYTKSQERDLTRQQLQMLARLVEEEFK